MDAKALLHFEPELIFDYAKVRDFDRFPILFRIRPCDPPARGWIAYIANFVPDENAAVNWDAQHARALVARSVQGVACPGCSSWRGDAIAIEVSGDVTR